MIKKWIYFFAIVSLAACEQVIDIDMPPHQNRLVVNSINGTDSLFYFFVSKSRGITEPTAPYEFIDNAKIKIFRGDNLLEIIEGTTVEDGYRYASSLARPETKNTYRIEVVAPGFDQVIASDEAPSATKIKEIELDLKNKTTRDYTTHYQLTVTFSDPATEKNYYMVQAFFRITYSNEEEDEEVHKWGDFFVKLYSDDPLIQNENNTDSRFTPDLLFTDVAFDGKQDIKLNLGFRSFSMYPYSNMYTIRSAECHVVLKSTSEALYKYVRSQNLQLDAQDNPFAEPVKVFNNITEGYGIFGIYANDVIKIEIPVEDLEELM